MHNEHVFTSGIVAAPMVPTPEHLRRLDAGIAESVNGVDGGTWAPENPIIVGGFGVQAQGASATMIGGVETGRGAFGLVLPSAYPTFATPRTKTVVVNFVPTGDFAYLASARGYVFVSNPMGIRVDGSGITTIRFLLDSLLVHHNATIKRAYLHWRCGVKPTTFGTTGQNMPGARLLRLDSTTTTDTVLYSLPAWQAGWPYVVDDLVRSTNGGAWSGSNDRTYRCITAGTSGGAEPAPWNTTLGGTQNDGSVVWRVESGWDNAGYIQRPPFPAGASFDTYFNAGAPQSMLVRANQNKVVDTTNFGYALEIVDPGAQVCTYHSLVLELEAIADMREA